MGLACETPDPRELPTCGSPACTDPEHAPAAVTDPQVSAALAAVSEASAGDRACVLQRELRRLAALDSQELAPAVEEGDVGGLYPVTEEDAGVVLARLRILLTVSTATACGLDMARSTSEAGGRSCRPPPCRT